MRLFEGAQLKLTSINELSYTLILMRMSFLRLGLGTAAHKVLLVQSSFDCLSAGFLLLNCL